MVFNRYNQQNEIMIGVCLKCEQRNYGSKLQALATLQAFKDLGKEYRILKYRKRGLWFKMKSLPRIFNIVFLNDRYDHWQKVYSFKKHPEVKEKIQQRNLLFKDYDKKHFEKEFIYIDYYSQLKKEAYKYSSIITCSDQLWSPAALSTNFYNLMFVPNNINKVSFASSFGVSKLPWYQLKRTKVFIDRIEHVSVRENQGRIIIKKLTNRDVPVLMDPVFLYTKDEWEKLVPMENVNLPPYILCYFLGNNIAYRKAAQKFAKKNGFKIVTLPHLDRYVPMDEEIADYPLFNVDPNKFLNLIRHAECICTDSFHGCAFSIILEKKFFVFNRYSNNSINSKNSRIDSLCDNLNLNCCRANETSNLFELDKYDIDYIMVKEKIKKYIDVARWYLKESII